MGEFTPDEEKILAPFMTNLDKPIFALVNLPEVVKGALFSRYSRTTKSLRRVLLEEFILNKDMGFKEIVNHQTDSGTEQVVAIKKAEEFYDRVLVGYGDDSVAELAGAHVAIEQVSNIATKILQDSRLGLSPLEKSTRYVYFDQKVNGKWQYYEEPTIMQSEFADNYVKTCDLLFETYAKLIEKMSKYFMDKYPKTAEVSDRAYNSTIRAKTCDVLRGLLPASTLTNMGFFGDGRAYEYLLTKLYASNLAESKQIAKMLQEELAKVIPSFVKRANDKYGQSMQEYWTATSNETRKKVETTLAGFKHDNDREVTLVDYDKDADEKISAAILYQYSDLSMEQCLIIARNMGAQDKDDLVSSYLGKRGNRRHKPGRAFEHAYYTFDILANFGAYRDLHRHRVLTQTRQQLSTKHGYTLPPELIEAGFESEFKNAMDIAKQTYEKIAEKLPEQAQYVVPLAYKIRWNIKLNAREAIHMCELRSMQQGHIDYRKVAQEMFTEINKVHPMIGKHFNFMDMKSYDFERLESEKKLDKKLEELKKKYG
ncbi:MAG: FAD-dependent thymidylate synthase [Candidatus Micrarchaeota archaeon]|nr:FAD-dependent thymidylate synthase [Candidatus Micrarchaeota archaeon]